MKSGPVRSQLAAIAFLALGSPGCDEAAPAPPDGSAPRVPGPPPSLTANPSAAASGRCSRPETVEATPAMRSFLSRLGSPGRSRRALAEFAAPKTDVRPMRWTTFERTEIYCRRTDPDGADCFEVRAIHEVTVSGYSLWSQYEICWRGDRIVRVERLGGGAHGG